MQNINIDLQVVENLLKSDSLLVLAQALLMKLKSDYDQDISEIHAYKEMSGNLVFDEEYPFSLFTCMSREYGEYNYLVYLSIVLGANKIEIPSRSFKVYGEGNKVARVIKIENRELTTLFNVDGEEKPDIMFLMSSRGFNLHYSPRYYDMLQDSVGVLKNNQVLSNLLSDSFGITQYYVSQLRQLLVEK